MDSNPRIGTYIDAENDSEHYQAYVPKALPPEPAVNYSDNLIIAIANAKFALGRLNAMSEVYCEHRNFVDLLLAKEAWHSFLLTDKSMEFFEFLLYLNQDPIQAPSEDLVTLHNIELAIQFGTEKLEHLYPLGTRLINDTHSKLFFNQPSGKSFPGETRFKQQWVGGVSPGTALFVPPPPEQVMKSMVALESFIQADNVPLESIVKIAMAHSQFHSIHPFFDANGRMSRVLLILHAISEELIKYPVLGMSRFIERNRLRYYDLLQRVRIYGDWEAWLEFFMQGVAESAEHNAQLLHQMVGQFKQDGRKVFATKNHSKSHKKVYEYFRKHPIASIKKIEQDLSLTFPTVNASIEKLIEQEVIVELTGKERGRIFAYQAVLKLLEE